MLFVAFTIATTLTLGPLNAKPIEFEDLANRGLNGQHVQIRGFAYRTSDDQWILSSDPHLKSCCIGIPAKAAEQVTVRGDFPALPTAQAIVIEGVLTTNPPDGSGLYSMSNARIIEGARFPWLTLSAIISLLAIVGIYTVTLKKKS